MIKPTVGRVVWFHLVPDAPEQAAIVAYVHSDRLVNLTVFDHIGQPIPKTSVTLRQDEDPVPSGSYCEWMPYQLGQAAKTEAALRSAGIAN